MKKAESDQKDRKKKKKDSKEICHGQEQTRGLQEEVVSGVWFSSEFT